jgi:hypothetical protein
MKSLTVKSILTIIVVMLFAVLIAFTVALLTKTIKLYPDPTPDNTTKTISLTNAKSDDLVIFREAIVLEPPTIINGSEGECLKVKVKAQPKAMGLDKFIEFIIIPKYALKRNIQKGDTIKYMEGHTAAKDGTLHANMFRIYIP